MILVSHLAQLILFLLVLVVIGGKLVVGKQGNLLHLE
jgi:hypothetical protein